MLRKATQTDIEKIKPYIEEFKLDSEDLDYEKFYIFECNGVIAGFGRYKNYGTCYEIATIGVLKKYRTKGIGRIIINQLLKAIPSDEVWLTTVIPDYFREFGFKESKNIPDALLLKTQSICAKFKKSMEFSVFMKLNR